MLNALMKKVDNMQEQMGSINNDMDILRNHQKKMLEIKKYTITEIENVFDGLTIKLNIAEK